MFLDPATGKYADCGWGHNSMFSAYILFLSSHAPTQLPEQQIRVPGYANFEVWTET